MKNDIFKVFFGFGNIIIQKIIELLSNIMTTEFSIFGLARLTWICNPSTDSKTSLKVMSYWKFKKNQAKTKIFY